MQNSRMRGQAGPDRRMSVVLRPVQQLCQASPVWLVPKVQRPRLCPGDDEAVEMIFPEIPDVGIEAADMLLAQIRSGNVRQRIYLQAHHDAVGRRIELCAKLPFRRFQRRAGHVVDEAYIDTVGSRLSELDR